MKKYYFNSFLVSLEDFKEKYKEYSARGVDMKLSQLLKMKKIKYISSSNYVFEIKETGIEEKILTKETKIDKWKNSTELTTGILSFEKKLTDEQIDKLIKTIMEDNDFKDSINCTPNLKYNYIDKKHEYELKVKLIKDGV